MGMVKISRIKARASGSFSFLAPGLRLRACPFFQSRRGTQRRVMPSRPDAAPCVRLPRQRDFRYLRQQAFCPAPLVDVVAIAIEIADPMRRNRAERHRARSTQITGSSKKMPLSSGLNGTIANGELSKPHTTRTARLKSPLRSGDGYPPYPPPAYQSTKRSCRRYRP